MKNQKNNNITKDKNIPLSDYLLRKEFKYGYPVWLNIYHLTCLNYFFQFIGLGIYHSTIEIYSYEYSFGPTKEDDPGFFRNKIGEIGQKLILKEKIYLGNTIYSEKEFIKILELESPYWMGRTYDPFVKNCNHFSKNLSKILLNEDKINFPLYVNRMTKFASFFSSFYPPIKRLYGNLSRRITSQIKVDINMKNIFDLDNMSIPKTNTKNNIYHNSRYKNLTEDNEKNKSNEKLREDKRDDTDKNTYVKINNSDLNNISANIKRNGDKNLSRSQNNNNNSSSRSTHFKKEKGNQRINYLDTEDIRVDISMTKEPLNDNTNMKIKKFYYKLIDVLQKNPFLFPLNYDKFFEIEIIKTKFNQIFENLQKLDNEFSLEFNIKNSCENKNENSEISDEISERHKRINYSKNKMKLIYLDDKIDFCLDHLIASEKELEKSFPNFEISSFLPCLEIKNKSICYFFKMKLYHMKNFIALYNRKLSVEEKELEVDKILLLDPDDFYALYSLSYIRCVQLRIPESSELISNLQRKNATDKIKNHDYALNLFFNMINNL